MFPICPPPPPSFHGRVHPSAPFFHGRVHPPAPFSQAVQVPPPHADVPVQPVWAWNFDQQSTILRSFAADARFVAVNVQYPGVVHLPGKDHNALTAEQRYALLKANVDALKPLQVGIAVRDRHGMSRAWEFNLREFRRLADPHDVKSIAYLAGRGLDVDKLAQHGVDALSLGAILVSSGLIGPESGLSWITYTGAYHVAYLLKIVTGGDPLPPDMDKFVGAVRQFLGEQVYDVARMAADCPALPVGLERISAHLGLHRHRASPWLAAAAGLRALLVFRKLEQGQFEGNVERYKGLLQGM
ncbi:probable CCR4-associated factor 1 homolog 11 [Lolium rigidum]|uniref:probable CCR4-associated factor 1 homolog 11 n=1 Tax=Lolium rigidum TaxID=89674 RepID=UPI001F5CD47C|nr:probable CCR4-associated factor 1 homolog 11 [Lolium rigidum]